MLSSEYCQQLIEKHSSDPTWGNTGVRYFMKVLQLCEEYNIKSILDFGCGKGSLGDKFREEQKPQTFEGENGNETVESGLKHITFQEWDPAAEGKQEPYKPADLVVCTDVLEHVEREHLDTVLRELRLNTERVAYFVISCRPAFHKLPNGDNAHLIVEPPEWWRTKLQRHFQIVDFRFIQNNSELCVICL